MSNVVTLECRHGTISFLRHDDPVGRALLEYGEWAEQEILLLVQLVRDGDTVLDVGANVGTHTLPLAARAGPLGRVIAFEPQEPIYDLLRQNVVRNHLATVEVRRQGIAGGPGEMGVPLVDYASRLNAGGVALVPSDGSVPQATPVSVTSLDALELARCDLVKLDVEGMELAALRGARATIARCASLIYAECNRIEAGWEVACFARELGHGVFFHRARAYNEQNFFKNPKNFFGVAHETSLLLVPPSRQHEVAAIVARWDLAPIVSLDDLARAMLATPRWGDPDLRGVSVLDQARQIETLSREVRERDARIEAALEREARFGRVEGELAEAERRLLHLKSVRDGERARPRNVAARIRAAVRTLRGRNKPEERSTSKTERLVAESGLFEPGYYRSNNPDLARCTDAELLRHYVDHGGREGRDPCPLFDSSHYLDSNPDVRASGMNPLVHFLTYGSAEGRNPNPLFDTRYYSSRPRVACSRLNPLFHYLRFGAAGGLDPSPTFDTAAYLDEHSELRANGANPLVHRLAAVNAERAAIYDDERLRNCRKASPSVAPSREEWAPIVARSAGGRESAAPVVDVVVPVFRGFHQTLRCLHSVLSASCATPHAVIVIEDATPERELRHELEFLAGTGLIELIHNERNSGFVATCNRGMSLHSDRDVVLLNSDTEVYGNWLDRLRAAARRTPRIGSVTPLSNSATICSYPFFPRDNDMALELAYAEVDRLAASVNAGESIPIPTAVGFCMYVRRPCLDEVGLFDLERFGRGYGEENDFSLRASERGWTHVLASDVFIRHIGGVSFGPEKQARMEQALAKIHERFPDYVSTVAEFVAADPPRGARRRLDLARLASRVKSQSFLFVTHNWGGGIERHVQDLRRGLEAEGVAVFFLRPHPTQQHLALLSHPDAWPTPNIGPFEVHSGLGSLIATLRELRVAHVHVHSLVGFDQPRAAKWVPIVSRGLGVTYDFTVHDYLSVCPRINLIDASGVYCGERGVDACDTCLTTSGSPFGTVAIQKWRDAYGQFLRGARVVVAPGKDAAARIAAHFPGLSPEVKRHIEEPFELSTASPGRRARRGALRIAVIGAIGPHKGHDVLRACARDAAERRLPLSFHLVGYSCNDAALTEFGNVTIVGRYEDAELSRLLTEQRCDCAFFASVWPETYSYTLSAAITHGLYPIAFDLGVVAERIRDLGWGTLIPLTTDPVTVNDALLGAQIGPPPARATVRSTFASCESLVRDYYGLRLS